MGWIFWQGVHSHVCNNGEFIFAGYPLWSVLCLLYPLSYSFLRILPPRPCLGTPSVSLFLNSFGPPSHPVCSYPQRLLLPPAHLRRLLFNPFFLYRPFLYSWFPLPLSPSTLIPLFPSSRMLSSIFPLRRTFICLLTRLPATPILPISTYPSRLIALPLPLLTSVALTSYKLSQYSVLKRWCIAWTKRWRGIMKRM